MKCLHGEPASTSTTRNGSFWFCGQSSTCNFFCSEDDGYSFEKAIDAWRSTNQPQPLCGGHCKLAKMRVVKDMMKDSYGRPFFVCSDKKSPCSFWVWGDVQPVMRPTCNHGFPCLTLKVKKEGVNKGRMFFSCPNGRENSCRYFEWAPEEGEGSLQPVNFSVAEPRSQKTSEEGNYFKNCYDNLARSFQTMNIK